MRFSYPTWKGGAVVAEVIVGHPSNKEENFEQKKTNWSDLSMERRMKYGAQQMCTAKGLWPV